MNEEEMKSRVDKLTCGMTEEETDALYNEILKLPKFEIPISAPTCEILAKEGDNNE